MRTVFWTGLAAFLGDQLSKYAVIHMLDLSRIRSIDILSPVLNFRYGENRGINFGLFGDGSDTSRWILIGIALLICAGILIWLIRTPMGRMAHAGAGLLIGGALANVLDRLLYGHVLDFLNMSCCGINNPFVFNLADVFIFAGAIGLVYFAPDSKTSGKKGQ